MYILLDVDQVCLSWFSPFLNMPQDKVKIFKVSQYGVSDKKDVILTYIPSYGNYCQCVYL